MTTSVALIIVRNILSGCFTTFTFTTVLKYTMSTVEVLALSSESDESATEGTESSQGSVSTQKQTREEPQSNLKGKKRKAEAEPSKMKKKRQEKRTVGWILCQFWKAVFTVGLLEDIIQKVDTAVEGISEKKWFPLVPLWSCLRMLMTAEMLPDVTDSQITNDFQRKSQVIQPPSGIYEANMCEKSRGFFLHACSSDQAEKLLSFLKDAENQSTTNTGMPKLPSTAWKIPMLPNTTQIKRTDHTYSKPSTLPSTARQESLPDTNTQQTSEWLDDDPELESLLNSAQFPGSISFSTYTKGPDGCTTLKTPPQDGSTLYQLSVYNFRDVKHVSQRERWRHAKRRITIASQYPGDRLDQIMREFVHVATDFIVNTKGVLKE